LLAHRHLHRRVQHLQQIGRFVPADGLPGGGEVADPLANTGVLQIITGGVTGAVDRIASAPRRLRAIAAINIVRCERRLARGQSSRVHPHLRAGVSLEGVIIDWWFRDFFR
jgi:hypothetical protein